MGEKMPQVQHWNTWSTAKAADFPNVTCHGNQRLYMLFLEWLKPDAIHLIRYMRSWRLLFFQCVAKRKRTANYSTPFQITANQDWLALQQDTNLRRFFRAFSKLARLKIAKNNRFFGIITQRRKWQKISEEEEK
jgi:hypothetical protein